MILVSFNARNTVKLKDWGCHGRRNCSAGFIIIAKEAIKDFDNA